MDANKAQVLRDINYKINPACGMCQFGTFRPGSLFGDCQARSYKHLKHSADSKALSVFMYGYCDAYSFDAKYLSQIHAFDEFL